MEVVLIVGSIRAGCVGVECHAATWMRVVKCVASSNSVGFLMNRWRLLRSFM